MPERPGFACILHLVDHSHSAQFQWPDGPKRIHSKSLLIGYVRIADPAAGGAYSAHDRNGMLLLTVKQLQRNQYMGLLFCSVPFAQLRNEGERR
jgi:hypothetical protein